MNTQDVHLYKGINDSLGDSINVIELYVEAKEADAYFYWVASSNNLVADFKCKFPNLRKIIIEDDYLIQPQIDALVSQVPPIELKWTCRMHIDGRHGR